VVPVASTIVLGSIRVGTGLAIAPGTGVLSTVLPTASVSTRGVVQIGSGLTINPSGVLSTLPSTQLITFASAVNCIGFSNIVGGWNNDTNYFDVFPPSGKTMTNLLGFMASLSKIYFAGNVNQDDSLRTEWEVQPTRIRVWVQNTEQRAIPAGNYIAIWS
jgi:hypothetical protein